MVHQFQQYVQDIVLHVNLSVYNHSYLEDTFLLKPRAVQIYVLEFGTASVVLQCKVLYMTMLKTLQYNLMLAVQNMCFILHCRIIMATTT